MSNADLDKASSDFAPPASALKNPLPPLPASGDNAAMLTEPPKAADPFRA